MKKESAKSIGAGKASTSVEDADAAYSCFPGLRKIKYFDMKVKKGMTLSVGFIKSWEVEI